MSKIRRTSKTNLPSLKGKMASKKAVFPKWTSADLGLQAGQVGAAGAGAAVVKAALPPARPAGLKVDGATAAEKAAKLVDILLERKLI